MMPPFSVSQFTTWHQTFEQDISLYRQLGIGGIEVCERKLSENRDEALDQLKLVADSGLKVTSVQPRCHALFEDSMCPGVTGLDERAQRFRQTMDLFAEAFPDQNLPLVTISGKAADTNFRQAYAEARRIYSGHARYAHDRGLRIMFEPLNPVLMNLDSFVCSLNDAMRLIDEVDHPSMGLMLDMWHVWHEPAIRERIAQLDGGKIFGVHVCDWPHGGPRHVGDRVLPGDGEIDLPHLLGAIEKSGYDGPYCLEIFSLDHLENSLWRDNPERVIRDGQSGFLKCWEARS